MPTSGIVAGSGMDKETANYRHHERCSTCCHFYPPNSCESIKGNISPEAVCNRWEIKPRPRGKDGSFYLNEYGKSQAGKPSVVN